MRNLKTIEEAYKNEIIKKGKDEKKMIEREENFLGNVYYKLDE